MTFQNNLKFVLTGCEIVKLFNDLKLYILHAEYIYIYIFTEFIYNFFINSQIYINKIRKLLKNINNKLYEKWWKLHEKYNLNYYMNRQLFFFIVL